MKRTAKASKATVIIAVVLAVCAVAGIAAVITALVREFGYRDLGISYDSDDISSAVGKIGITDPDGADIAQELARLRNEGKKLGVDYTLEYSDFTQKSFTLTPAEATAVVNEYMISLSFCENSQINCTGDSVEVSSSLKLHDTLAVLFPDVVFNVPQNTARVNFNASGTARITDNMLYFTPDKMESGILRFLPFTAGQELIVDLSAALASPELVISDMRIENGDIAITGNVPQTVRVVML